ncbi:MAG: sodium:proton exchanger [Actinobacteria bacterium]|nr:sodium:proton exchanger [Actinomycetota bacterium]
MHDATTFGAVILLASAALVISLGTSKLSERFAIPVAAPFLVLAAIASDIFPRLSSSIGTVERVSTVALVVILFDGGLAIGWKRFRVSAAPIATLGVIGTFATAGGIAVVAHWVIGFSWISSGLIGAAVAPTDPAVMFSVLGNREIEGRTGTILQGESGANDPVGIALMIGMLELATHPGSSFWVVIRTFSMQMVVGLAIGVVGGIVLGQTMRRVSLPSAGLYSLRTLAAAGVIYGVATVAHGSGFLAVFVAGLLVGDVQAPFKEEIETFHDALSSLAEFVVFLVLGLTISLSAMDVGVWADGLLLAAILAFVVRPVACWPLLIPFHLRKGEQAFVLWGGLKGAVPILLAAFAVARGVADADRIYELVFVVVLASVLVQGTTIAAAARRLGVEMR